MTNQYYLQFLITIYDGIVLTTKLIIIKVYNYQILYIKLHLNFK